MADAGFQDSQQVAKELDALIKQIETLKMAYDQYFQGIKKEEPLKLRNEVQDRVRRLSSASVQNASLKFKLAQAVARYTTFSQHWARILKKIEEGRYERDIFLANLHESQRKAASGDHANQGEHKKTTHGTPTPQQDLFSQFLKAREQCGEPTKGLTAEKFQQTLLQQTAALKDKVPAGKTLQFKIVVENGKSKIKAFI